MSTDVIAAAKALPIEELRSVVDELCRHLDQIDPDPDLTPEFEAELDRRIESARLHPERLVDLDEIKAEIAARRKRVE